jgi:hypothetical protein
MSGRGKLKSSSSSSSSKSKKKDKQKTTKKSENEKQKEKRVSKDPVKSSTKIDRNQLAKISEKVLCMTDIFNNINQNSINDFDQYLEKTLNLTEHERKLFKCYLSRRDIPELNIITELIREEFKNSELSVLFHFTNLNPVSISKNKFKNSQISFQDCIECLEFYEQYIYIFSNFKKELKRQDLITFFEKVRNDFLYVLTHQRENQNEEDEEEDSEMLENFKLFNKSDMKENILKHHIRFEEKTINKIDDVIKKLNNNSKDVYVIKLTNESVEKTKEGNSENVFKHIIRDFLSTTGGVNRSVYEIIKTFIIWLLELKWMLVLEKGLFSIILINGYYDIPLSLIDPIINNEIIKKYLDEIPLKNLEKLKSLIENKKLNEKRLDEIRGELQKILLEESFIPIAKRIFKKDSHWDIERIKKEIFNDFSIPDLLLCLIIKQITSMEYLQRITNIISISVSDSNLEKNNSSESKSLENNNNESINKVIKESITDKTSENITNNNKVVKFNIIEGDILTDEEAVQVIDYIYTLYFDPKKSDIVQKNPGIEKVIPKSDYVTHTALIHKINEYLEERKINKKLVKGKGYWKILCKQFHSSQSAKCKILRNGYFNDQKIKELKNLLEESKGKPEVNKKRKKEESSEKDQSKKANNNNNNEENNIDTIPMDIEPVNSIGYFIQRLQKNEDNKQFKEIKNTFSLIFRQMLKLMILHTECIAQIQQKEYMSNKYINEQYFLFIKILLNLGTTNHEMIEIEFKEINENILPHIKNKTDHLFDSLEISELKKKQPQCSILISTCVLNQIEHVFKSNDIITSNYKEKDKKIDYIKILYIYYNNHLFKYCNNFMKKFNEVYTSNNDELLLRFFVDDLQEIYSLMLFTSSFSQFLFYLTETK